MAKTIVITGVTRGIGRGLAVELDRLGHKVIGCGRSADPVAELQTTLGQSHDFAAMDVTDDRAVADWARRTLAEHGAPDLLINNAAIINGNANLVEVPVAEFDAVIDVNIKGVANVIRHFAPAMIEHNHGVIVNLSSGWGRGTSPEVAPYCATKWAMEGLSKATCRRAAKRHGLRAAQPRHGEHRDAAKLLRRRSRFRAQAGRLRQGRRAVPARAWPERQWPVAHRPLLSAPRTKQPAKG